FAEQYFARAIAASPHSLDPHIHMETVLVRAFSGDPAHDREIYEDIIRIDSQLLEIDPYIPFPRKNLASAYYKLGQRERAMKEMETAIQYEPNYVPGYLQIADWYGERGDTVAHDRYTAAAINIINKYRNFKPTQLYESILLGRPVEASATLATQDR